MVFKGRKGKGGPHFGSSLFGPEKYLSALCQKVLKGLVNGGKVELKAGGQKFLRQDFLAGENDVGKFPQSQV